MKTTTPKPVRHACDFCRAQGLLEVHIFNKDGWYFCIPCLQEMAAWRRPSLVLRHSPSGKTHSPKVKGPDSPSTPGLPPTA